MYETKTLDKRVLVAIMAMSVCVSACSTGPVNTTNPSTGDLLFRYDELEEYLASRRSQLSGLQSDLIAINTRLLKQRTDLAEAKDALLDAEEEGQISQAELEAAERELAEAQRKSDATLALLEETRQERDDLDKQVVTQQQQAEADRRLMAGLSDATAQLEREVAALESGSELVLTNRLRSRPDN